MLGKLAVYLRMCGYDTAYAGDRGITADDAMRGLAIAEERRLLSRDRSLVASTPEAIFVESHAVEDQIAELREAGIDIDLGDRPRRCGRCNGPLDPEPEDRPRPDYAPTDPAVDCFRCRECGRYFWEGSHWEDVADRL